MIDISVPVFDDSKLTMLIDGKLANAIRFKLMRLNQQN